MKEIKPVLDKVTAALSGLPGIMAVAVSALNQVLFALNEEYCLNEKKAVRMIGGFAIKPDRYQERIAAIFQLAGNDSREACGLLRGLVEEIKHLGDGR